ncbi:MAG TPA: HAMP domain-containing protein, partial [Gammaproteobacteria bacterium]|nr:HAMP domain-containing protein [Gammaproteobacteria bacterium]
MKLDREALVSPKLLIGGGILLLGFALIAMLYFQAYSLGDQVIQLLQQPGGSANITSEIDKLIAERNHKHWVVMTAGIVFALMIVVISITISQTIIGPLRRTIEYTDDIALGKLGERASYWASGEVANVRDAVSDMQNQLTQVV